MMATPASPRASRVELVAHRAAYRAVAERKAQRALVSWKARRAARSRRLAAQAVDPPPDDSVADPMLRRLQHEDKTMDGAGGVDGGDGGGDDGENVASAANGDAANFTVRDCVHEGCSCAMDCS